MSWIERSHLLSTNQNLQSQYHTQHDEMSELKVKLEMQSALVASQGNINLQLKESLKVSERFCFVRSSTDLLRVECLLCAYCAFDVVRSSSSSMPRLCFLDMLLLPLCVELLYYCCCRFYDLICISFYNHQKTRYVHRMKQTLFTRAGAEQIPLEKNDPCVVYVRIRFHE